MEATCSDMQQGQFSVKSQRVEDLEFGQDPGTVGKLSFRAFSSRPQIFISDLGFVAHKKSVKKLFLTGLLNPSVNFVQISPVFRAR